MVELMPFLQGWCLSRKTPVSACLAGRHHLAPSGKAHFYKIGPRSLVSGFYRICTYIKTWKITFPCLYAFYFPSIQAVISIEDKLYNVGGWDFSEIPRAYLNRTAVAANQRPDRESFQFAGYSRKALTPR